MKDYAWLPVFSFETLFIPLGGVNLIFETGACIHRWRIYLLCAKTLSCRGNSSCWQRLPSMPLVASRSCCDPRHQYTHRDTTFGRLRTPLNRRIVGGYTLISWNLAETIR